MNNRALKGLLVVAPLPLLVSVIVPLELTKRLTLFPGDSAFGVYAGADDSEGGNSRNRGCEIRDNILRFRFVLKKGARYPWVHLALVYGASGRRLDVSSYQKLEVKMRARHARAVVIGLQTSFEGAGPDEYRPSLIEAPVGAESAVGAYGIDRFTTPLWWAAGRGSDAGPLGSPDYRQVRGIQFSSAPVQPYDVEEEWAVESIALLRDGAPWYAAACVVAFAYYVALYFTAIELRYRKTVAAAKENSEFPFPRVRMENRSDLDAKKVFAFMLAHFQDPEISIKAINRETGVSDYKISKIIRDKFSLSFRQYLNAARLEEAKRLILQTDRPITEIAFSVGYNNISHFNRVFKRMESVPPTEFRKRRKPMSD